MTQIVRQIFLCTAALALLNACQSIPEYKDSYFGPKASHTSKSSEFEHGSYLPASDFLAPEWMQSGLHNIAPQTYNDGYANTYKIITEKHIYIVQGTEQVKERVYEIKAVQSLFATPTLFAATKAFKDRTKNLVQTPIRAVKGGAARYADVKTSKYGLPEDSLATISSGLGTVIGALGRGLQELGTTGVRLTTSATGTQCSGIGQCARKAGGDIWSGVNSLTGKHAAARRLHKRLGTDPYSDNAVLQKEISRLAYAESYTGTGYKFGVAGAGITIISPLAKGVGYYNNVEFAAQYEDAHKRRNIEKELYAAWGAHKKAVNALYKNPAFTHTTRTRLASALAKINSPVFRAHAVQNASTLETRYVAASKLAIYQYLAKLERSGVTHGYVDAPMAIAVSRSGALILPLSADYVQWTQDMATLVQDFAALRNTGQARPEIHILGQASPRFKTNAQKLGINVLEISTPS